ncbi:hypothetical protein AB0C40_22055 [Streptomyces brevispora]|uniref:hypothetical protein n=1 Tax=Streptomyces brevispora TaxID=887462 RepID=UPI0033C2BE3A
MRVPARVTEASATLPADGYDAGAVSSDDEARELLETEVFGVPIIGGGVGPDSRAAITEFTAKHRVRRVSDGALTEPSDAFARREFEPMIREAAATA